jgi:hypothetical protein
MRALLSGPSDRFRSYITKELVMQFRNWIWPVLDLAKELMLYCLKMALGILIIVAIVATLFS